jgi:hypothetical protein
VEPADSPASELQPPPAESRRSVEAKTADREERRKAHFERALAAAGKAPAAKTDEEDEADPDEIDPADVPLEKDETAEEKSERLAKLDKVKSHKHLAKAKDALAGEVKKFEDDRKEFERDRVKQQRINDAATETYGPIVVGQQQYQAKDYRNAKATVEKFFGDKFENISRNLWNATKDGMATADLNYKVAELEKKLAEKDEQTTQQKEAETKATADKQARADFGKALKAHPLFESGDEELQARAYDKWKGSWDPDLEEYSLSKKKAADQIYSAELERAQRLTGKRPRPAATRETRERGNESTKPLKEMSREEKRKAHLDRALRATAMAKRERERHA